MDFTPSFSKPWAARLEWPFAEAETEAEAFRKDLEIYAGWRERNPTVPAPRKASKASRDESPFPDRCAILLDSGMMEQARRAAARFQSDLLRLGTRIFGQLGRLASQRRMSVTTKVRPARHGGRQRGNGSRDVRLRKSTKRSTRPRRRS